MSYRSQRLSEELKNEISVIIARELRDPRVGLTTVTEVKVSPDMSFAKVYVSVLGDATQRKETMQGLVKATGFVRRQIAARIKLRHAPQIVFAYDETIERGDKMMQIIEEVKKELPESSELESAELGVESPNSETQAPAGPAEEMTNTERRTPDAV